METRTDTPYPGEREKRETPGGRERSVAMLAYFGLGTLPGFDRWCRGRISAFSARHVARANVLLGLLVLVTAGFMTLGIAWGLADAGNSGKTASLLPDEWTLRLVFRRVVLVWLVCWTWGLLHAARGSMGWLPGIDGLAARRGIVQACRILFQAVALGLTCVAAIGARGLWLSRAASESPRCFLLYESMEGRLPSILFGFGYYPMIRAAAESRFLGGAALLPLNDANLARALREGEFIFVGSHGSASGILLADRVLSPADVARLKGDHHPRLVYLAGCHADVEGWKKALAPARVLAWNRQTGTAEHLAWIWHEGPRVIRELDGPPAAGDSLSASPARAADPVPGIRQSDTSTGRKLNVPAPPATTE